MATDKETLLGCLVPKQLVHEDPLTNMVPTMVGLKHIQHITLLVR